MTSSLDHSNDFAGLRRRPPLTCGRAPVESVTPKHAQARRKRALPAARGCWKKLYKSVKSRFRCETKPEGDVPDRPPKTKSYPRLGGGTVWGVITIGALIMWKFVLVLKFSNNPVPFLVH